MNNLKKIKFLILIVLVLIILTTIVLIWYSRKKSNENNQTRQEYTLELVNTIEDVYDKNTFNKLSNNITNYLYYLENKNYNAIYSLLDKTFVNKYKINEENVYKYFNYPNSDSKINIDKVYKLEVESDLITYFIYFNAKNQQYSIVINYDYNNLAYSICPFGYIYEEHIQYDVNKPSIQNIEEIRKERKKD